MVRRGGYEKKYTAEFRRTHTPGGRCAALLAVKGTRPDRVADVRPQERVPRRIVEQIVDSVPVVPLLHAPVPQTLDSVVEVLKILDKSLPDVEQQVLEVPKILQHTVPQRSSLLEPQMAEQLVAVPVIEFIVFRRLQGELGIAVCRDARTTCIMRVHDTGWRDTTSPGRYTNTGHR